MTMVYDSFLVLALKIVMMFSCGVFLICLLCRWVFPKQVELTQNNNDINSTASGEMELIQKCSSVNSTASGEMELIQKCSSVNSTASGEMELIQMSSSVNSSALTCIDKLKEELSCAICLEICFMPITTLCGHSFCRNCLQYAVDKCGEKCPKCRQFISNGRFCTVNTVLWNTIQLLFPQEIEARKVAASTLNNGQAAQSLSPETTLMTNIRDRTTRSRQTSTLSSRMRARRGVSNQDADTTFVLRSQRDELMRALRSSSQEHSSSSSTLLAGENLRATSTRATNLRIRAPWR